MQRLWTKTAQMAGRNRSRAKLAPTLSRTEIRRRRRPRWRSRSACANRLRLRRRQEFLTNVTLDPPNATSDEPGKPLLDEDYLILSTIHSAKGQEWKAVSILNVVDGCIPSDLATGTSEEIEEERRLLYVAMTRAKDELNLIVPQRFYTHGQARTGDRHVYAGRTRFIPANLTGHFNVSAGRPRAGKRCGARGSSGPRYQGTHARHVEQSKLTSPACSYSICGHVSKSRAPLGYRQNLSNRGNCAGLRLESNKKSPSAVQHRDPQGILSENSL